MGSRVRPGSCAHLILGCLETLTKALRRGASTAEAFDAFVAEGGAVSRRIFTATLASMVRRGVLEVVGGRAGQTLYAPAGSGLTGCERADDPIHRVVGAVRAFYQREQRAASTREVEAELARLGCTVAGNANTVRKYLETAAKQRSRGAMSFRSPQVLRIDALTGTGRPSTHWAPIEVEVPPRGPRSKAEAVRIATACAEDDLARPVSRSELRWWLERPEGEGAVAGVVSSSSISGHLSLTARTDARAAGAEGRLHQITTRYTCHGGAPARYIIGPPSEIDLALCELDDVLLLFRPEDERRTNWVLARRAEVQGSEALRLLAELRRDMLAHAVTRSARGLSDLPHLISRLEHANRRLRTWVGQAPRLTPDARQRRTDRLNDRDFQLQALPKVFWPAEAATGFHMAGEAALAMYDDLAPLRERAYQLLDPAGRRSSSLLDRARRFPLPPGGVARWGKAGEAPLAAIDRVDALVALFEPFPVPKAWSFLSSARLLLGDVFRDADLLLSIRRLTGPEEGALRRALLVAAGLLGVPLLFDEAFDSGRDTETAAAWVLSLILAAPSEASGRLSEAASAAGEVARTVDLAAMRLEAGYPFSVIG